MNNQNDHHDQQGAEYNSAHDPTSFLYQPADNELVIFDNDQMTYRPIKTQSEFNEFLLDQYGKQLLAELGAAKYAIFEKRIAQMFDYGRRLNFTEAQINKLVHKFIKDIDYQTQRETLSEFFDPIPKQYDQDLHQQREFLLEGQGARYVFFVDYIFKMVPARVWPTQLRMMPQPNKLYTATSGKQYPYACVEKNDRFKNDLKSFVSVYTGRPFSDRNYFRWIKAVCRCHIFENFQIPTKPSLLAVGYYRPLRTNTGRIMYVKHPITGVNKSGRLWRTITRFIHSDTYQWRRNAKTGHRKKKNIPISGPKLTR
jgi:hypothetical protein